MSARLYSIEPCIDPLAGGDDRRLYEEVGLDKAWTDRRIGASGSVSPREYFWTEDKAFRFWGASPLVLKQIREQTGGSFFALGLDAQCDLLGVPTRSVAKSEIAKHSTKSIEQAVLDWYCKQGWIGDCTEGAFFHALHSYCYHRFGEHFGGYMTAPLSQTPGLERQLRWVPEMFTAVSRDEVIRHDGFRVLGLKRQAEFRKMAKTYWDCIGKRELDRLVALIATRQYTNGWPDLMLANEARSSFLLVEVKQEGDSFTNRQAYWLRNVWRVLKWPFLVLKVDAR